MKFPGFKKKKKNFDILLARKKKTQKNVGYFGLIMYLCARYGEGKIIPVFCHFVYKLFLDYGIPFTRTVTLLFTFKTGIKNLYYS